MKTLLMSIKPCYSQAILAGEKTVEFRRVFGDAAAAADQVIIYESSPTMRIVGSFGIERVHTGLPYDYVRNVAVASGRLPGIDFNLYMSYMQGSKSATAIYIKDVIRYEIPIDPRQIDPKFYPPQSYRWMPEALADVVEKAEWGNRLARNARGGSFQ